MQKHGFLNSIAMSQFHQLADQINDIDTLLKLREMNLIQRWREVKKYPSSMIMRISTSYWHYDFTDLLALRKKIEEIYLMEADISELKTILQPNK